MSESKLPPIGPASDGVPHATRVRLYGEVARLKEPVLESGEQPLPTLMAVMRIEHPAILSWGSTVSDMINRGIVGSDPYVTNEKRAFDNAFFTAYGLIRAGYDESGRTIPGTQKPPKWYMWMRDQSQQSVPNTLAMLHERQRILSAEYPELFEATHAWAADRVPRYGTGRTVATVGIAVAEMYYAFTQVEETAALERMLES